MTMNAVLSHMEDMLSLHQLLLDVSEGKKQAIIANQVKDLAEWVSKESRLMKQVTAKQNLWRDTVAGLLVSLGRNPENSMTIADIAALVAPNEGGHQLLSLQQQLLDIIHELKARNQSNQQLIEQSLAFINYSLELSSGGFGQEMVYHNPSHSGQQLNGNILNNRFDTRA